MAEYLRVARERHGQGSLVYPGLIVGPGIVTGTENWPKEIVGVVPGAVGRVITIGAKPAPKALKVGAWVRRLFHENLSPTTEDGHRQYHRETGMAEKIIDDLAFEGLSAVEFMQRLQSTVSAISDPLIRQRAGERLRSAFRPLLATLERADRRQPRRRPHRRAPNLMDARLGGYLWLGHDLPVDQENGREIAGKSSVLEFIADYRHGVLPEKSFAIMSFETAKLGSGRVPGMTTRLWPLKYLDEHHKVRTRLEKVCACPACGAVIAVEEYGEDGQALEPLRPSQAEEWVGLRRRFCQAPRPRRVWDAEKGRHVDHYTDDNGLPYLCGAPLFEESDLRRMPAAAVVKRAKGVFGLLVIDELHKGAPRSCTH